LLNLADVTREQGNLERAARLTYEALMIASEAGPMFAVVDALDSMAEIAYAQRRSPLATHIFALATLLRETHDIPRPVGQTKACAARMDELHAMLGDKAFAAAWDQGQTLSLDEAIRLMSALMSASGAVTDHQNAVAHTRNGRK
jgi:hypothetical protein